MDGNSPLDKHDEYRDTSKCLWDGRASGTIRPRDGDADVPEQIHFQHDGRDILFRRSDMEYLGRRELPHDEFVTDVDYLYRGRNAQGGHVYVLVSDRLISADGFGGVNGDRGQSVGPCAAYISRQEVIDFCVEEGIELPSDLAVIPATYAAASLPHWDAETGMLTFSGGRKRLRPTATAIRHVLKAFQEEGWPEYIDNPVPPPAPATRSRKGRRRGTQTIPVSKLSDVLDSLNKSIPFLKFERGGGGKQVYWQPNMATGS